MKSIFVLILLCFCLGGCSDQSGSSSSTKPAQFVEEHVKKADTAVDTLSKSLSEHEEKPEAIPSEFTADNAVALIFELPEVKVWSDYIDQKSQGKVHAAILNTSTEPQYLDGKQYWSVDFFESQETHMHRWESFWVRIDGEEILVDDLADGPISLQEWRDQKKPLERIKS